MRNFPPVLQETVEMVETVAPAEEEPSPAEASAPVEEPNEVAAPTPAQSGVSLSISKGDDLFFSPPRRIYGDKPLAVFRGEAVLKPRLRQIWTA